jgi:hypothetical protein
MPTTSLGIRYPASTDNYRPHTDMQNLATDVDTLLVGEGPIQRRVATNIVTTNSALITTVETVVQTVVATLVAGRTYRITVAGACLTSQAPVNTRVRVREDSVSGTILQSRNCSTGPSAADAAPATYEAEYTAASSGSKTIVVTIQQQTGTGNHQWQASATSPAYLYVDYIRG